MPKTACLVLGAKVFNNDILSDMLRDRVDTAVELYNDKKVSKILVSGDHGKKSYDEVNTMRKYMLNKGVKAEDIFLDHAGFDTYDSIYRAQYIFQVKDLIIVTQEFHLPRAIYIAKSLNLDVIGVIADKREYPGIKYNYIREVPAKMKAFFNVLIKSSPKFLGEIIPITGDSRKSWDEL